MAEITERQDEAVRAKAADYVRSVLIETLSELAQGDNDVRIEVPHCGEMGIFEDGVVVVACKVGSRSQNSATTIARDVFDSLKKKGYMITYRSGGGAILFYTTTQAVEAAKGGAMKKVGGGG